MRAALFLLLFGCLGFGWWQNHGASIGGAISLAKILWLNLALACFFLIPAVLWRDPRAGDRTRLVYGLFLGSFLLRALIEAPMLYVWQNWRCGYGITHDLVMIVLQASVRHASPLFRIRMHQRGGLVSCCSSRLPVKHSMPGFSAAWPIRGKGSTLQALKQVLPRSTGSPGWRFPCSILPLFGGLGGILADESAEAAPRNPAMRSGHRRAARCHVCAV
jgi:hypothetical protein